MCFVYREANSVADLLSKIGLGVLPQQNDIQVPVSVLDAASVGLLYWDIEPDWLAAFVKKDLSLVATRFVSGSRLDGTCNLNVV